MREDYSEKFNPLRNTKRLALSASIFTLVCLIVACTQPEGKVSDTQGNEKAGFTPNPSLSGRKFASENDLIDDFIKRLKNGEDIAPLLTVQFDFKYYKDNRCDGASMSALAGLNADRIDSTVKLTVSNDGHGWSCEREAPSKYSFDFNLRAEVSRWNRIELGYFQPEPAMAIIEGRAESDYLIIDIKTLGQDFAISEIEYRSEDPG